MDVLGLLGSMSITGIMLFGYSLALLPPILLIAFGITFPFAIYFSHTWNSHHTTPPGAALNCLSTQGKVSMINSCRSSTPDMIDAAI